MTTMKKLSHRSLNAYLLKMISTWVNTLVGIQYQTKNSLQKASWQKFSVMKLEM
ncbi:Uncharacterised protein [Mycobacterium tuberculosis]|nr:Uncharacterised protein [Mycobacterium tuberculosis]